MRWIAVIALVVAGSIGAAGAAGTSQRATLRLIDRDPLTLAGRGFEARERVRVTLSAPASARRVKLANANGSFQVVFLSVSTDRCDQVRALATGDEGNRVILKILASPACPQA